MFPQGIRAYARSLVTEIADDGADGQVKAAVCTSVGYSGSVTASSDKTALLPLGSSASCSREALHCNGFHSLLRGGSGGSSQGHW